MDKQLTQVKSIIGNINEESELPKSFKVLPRLKKMRGVMPTRSLMKSKVLRPKSCFPGSKSGLKIKLENH